MTATTIVPALPGITEQFKHIPNIELLTKIALTAPALSMCLIGPFCGLFLNRFPSRMVLLYATLIFGVFGFYGFFAVSIYDLIVTRAFLGISATIVWTTTTSLIGIYYKGHERRVVLGYQAAATSAGAVIFMLAGGFLSEHSARLPFLIYLLPLLLLPGITKLITDLNAPKAKTRAQKVALSFSQKISVSSVLLISFFAMVTFYLLPTQLPFYIEGTLLLTPIFTGILIASNSTASTISSFFYKALSSYISDKIAVLSSLMIMGGVFLLAPLTNSFLDLLIISILSGLAMGIILPANNAWLLSDIPQIHSLNYLSLLVSMVFAGQFVSSVLWNPLIKIYGTLQAISFAGACTLVLAFIVALYFWNQFLSERKMKTKANES